VSPERHFCRDAAPSRRGGAPRGLGRRYLVADSLVASRPLADCALSGMFDSREEPGYVIGGYGMIVQRSFSAAVVLSVLLAPNSPQAQVLHTLASPNEEVGGFFGYSVAPAGDINGDGYQDLLVGALGESPGTSPYQSGRAYTYSGYDGELLQVLASPNEEQYGWFGCSVAGGADVDNDGLHDLIVGARFEDPGSSPIDAGRAYIFSGRTAQVLHLLSSPNEEEHGSFGCAVAALPDLDGDGCDDVLVGAYLESPGASPYRCGRAYVFSGQTGTPIRQLASPHEEYDGLFGYSVASCGDLNGDGCEEIMVGAPWETPRNLLHAGRVYMFDGATGAVHDSVTSPNAELYGFFGCSTSRIVDMDGGGVDDMLVGAACEDPGASPDSAGRVYVVSGETANVFRTLASPTPRPGGLFGLSVCDAGDADGDECHDVLIGAPGEDPGSSPENAGRAHIFCGRTGSVTHHLASPDQTSEGDFGWRVCGATDLDNDGCTEVVVGADCDSPAGSPGFCGRVYVFAPLVLSSVETAGQLVLQWTVCPGASAYWVYGASNLPYFEPGASPPYEYRLSVLLPMATTWASSSGVGDPTDNWSYVVLAADAGTDEICRSNRAAEHDFAVWVQR
jgi:hypothetical protein